MNDVAKAFFHEALEKADPSLTLEQREGVIVHVIDDVFDHPWADEELQGSVIRNLAHTLGLPVPEEYLDPNDEDEDEDEDKD